MPLMLSDVDVAYLAGLLEGEGCFDLTMKRNPRIRLCMTDGDVVYRVAEMLKVNPAKRVHMHDQRGLGKLPTFRLEINGKLALGLMWRIVNQMGTRRREKIHEIISAYEANSPSPAQA